MSLYIHIPFCRKACSYCDFHFSTNHQRMQDLVDALITEIHLRKNYLELNDNKQPLLETIYFGGGTPSLLSSKQLNQVFEAINKNFLIQKDAEITLEANPDDLTSEKLDELSQTPVNRLSIGVQSFFESDLILMNRAHDATMARQSVLDAASAGFKNITIDLIYGIPGLSDSQWKENLKIAMSLPVQHLSCYSLTIEKKTALEKMIREGNLAPVDDDRAAEHFKILMHETEQNGFEHYEISNFAKPGYHSKHNSSYWKNTPYIGIGPSAHSYDGNTRQWNISNNAKYIESISNSEIPATKEMLTVQNRYNEYLMTGLRTKWGVNADHILQEFGESYLSDFLFQMQNYVESNHVLCVDGNFTLSQPGKLIADQITAKGFVV